MSFQGSIRRRALVLNGFAGALVACAPAVLGPRAPTLADVIRRNTLARGGAAALDRVRDIAVDVEIVEGSNTLLGRYAANVAGMVRIDIYADGRNVYAEGVDGGGVWRWTGGPGPAEDSKAVGAANALTNGAEQHLFGWHRFAERGHRLALLPAETIDGVVYQVVEIRFTTGQTSYFYVDPASWHWTRRRDERAYHPDNDPTKQRIESRFFEFTAVDGIVASHRSEDFDLATGKSMATNRTLQRRINPGLAADHYHRDRRAPATL